MMPPEAKVTINGFELAEGQVAAVRVAVTRWLTDLGVGAHRAQLGPIGEGYRARLTEVEDLLTGSR
ncbi:MAG TPA: hypothetical protein VF765_31195 [Polyangiaceae bacterium]